MACIQRTLWIFLGVASLFYGTSSTILTHYGLVHLGNTDNEVFNSTDSNTGVTTTIVYMADSASATSSGGVYSVSSGPVIGGQDVFVNSTQYYSGATITNIPEMRISISIEEYDADSVTIVLYVENTGTDTAGYAEVDVQLDSGLKVDVGTFTTISYLADIQLTNQRYAFTWNVGNMAGGAEKNGSFRAYLQKAEYDQNPYLASAYLTYQHTTATSSQKYGPIQASVCIDPFINYDGNILYQHGFTALTFFMALIMGVLLVILGYFIYVIMRRKKSVSPSRANHQKVIHERGRTIMMNENEALKKTGHTINDYSVLGEGDSIVGLLGMKDKMQMHREIDSLDIVNTVNVDTDIEKERNDASIATTEILLSGLHSNNDISKGVLDNAQSNIRSRRTYMDRQNDEDYKREMKKLYKKISTKNRAMMNSMLQRQRNEKKQLVGSISGLPDKERNNLLNLMTEQHNSEQNAETYKLKLEQDEETEKLRKEFAIRGRMGMKEIQLQALSDVRDQGKLSDQQMKWLLAEHQKNQKSLEGLYDEEISKQRMSLEEKLARRKALAQAAETQEDENDYLLNTVASQQVVTIEKLKKTKHVSAAEANEMIDEMKQKMIAIKEKTEKERTVQEEHLHKKLSELKRKRLSDLTKEQEAELKEYQRKCNEMQADGPIDPMTYAKGFQTLMSQHREEKNTLEKEIDAEHSAELTKLRTSLATQTEEELKTVGREIQATLPLDSDKDRMVEKLMREHEQEVASLRTAQERNRDKQLQKLQEHLEKNREIAVQRKEAERVEQGQLREYEDQVVSKLVNSQVSMSDEERERILKEHEKHMVTLENSLTLNKLRQKRMMEEKLAQRRAAQLEKLQLKQYKEKESQRRQIENNGDDSEDSDVQQKKVELMKEHVEQKMSVLQGRKMEWDTELESIRVEMLKERSLALKEQEERLGALVAGLQMSKAKEIAKIEEQQQAIHKLKTNLIDDLNSRGVLSDPETKAVIQRHHDEQEKLNSRLEEQRQRQEEILRQKLQQRLMAREKSMIQQQDEELKSLVAPNKTAAKIKKMLLIHKHMVEMEKMRNQLEREISQTLEQVKHEYEIIKRKAIQNQEMEFISGLVRVGTIPKSELVSVLGMLYPNKTDEELKEIMDQLVDPKLQSLVNDKEAISTHLAERIKQAQRFPPPLSRRASQVSQMSEESQSSRNSSIKKSKKKKAVPLTTAQQQQALYDDAEYVEESRFRPSSRQEAMGDHPHPLENGYSYTNKGFQQNGNLLSNSIREEDEDDDIVSAQYVRGDTLRAQQLPSKLPPLETGKRKKKKKFLKKMASPRDYDDDEML